MRIFTARASVPSQIPYIEQWCLKHFGKTLPVTNIKDFAMIELWDDRAIQVIPNTGKRLAYASLFVYNNFIHQHEIFKMTLHTDTIIGYKVFSNDFTCRDYDFKGVGTTHTYEGIPVLCESGFHFCTTLEDCFNYYDISKNMIVCEVQATNYTNAEDGCSKRTCQTITIIRQLSLEEVKSHISNSENAYYWAKNIGDKEHMKQYITDGYYAYWWAKHIGDKEYMKQYVTDSLYAYFWAKNIGDKEHMKQYINDSHYAYEWAYNIGDKEYMINKFPEIAERLA